MAQNLLHLSHMVCRVPFVMCRSKRSAAWTQGGTVTSRELQSSKYGSVSASLIWPALTPPACAGLAGRPTSVRGAGRLLAPHLSATGAPVTPTSSSTSYQRMATTAIGFPVAPDPDGCANAENYAVKACQNYRAYSRV
jgi:hypothetical protein